MRICFMHTACYKGFHCQYSVSTETGDLTLTTLYVRTEDDVYPPIDGVDPVLQGVSFSNNNGNNTSNNRNDATILQATYIGLQVPMTHFTGRIRIGADVLPWPETDAFEGDASAYKRVLELNVEQGRVMAAKDLSEEVAARRKENNEGGTSECHLFSWAFDRIKFQLEDMKQNPGRYPKDHEDDL
eukprot:CAMPEP_0119016092 /NCGR_PEP_ID=MMETSP1176-20130426/11810_1 /TAXON_ID=265551 /ORGANISM="Synedropsis recta cf, Strain CCMP1620" /LENGTH=184 /DNA_ID=CAMNT_0006969419 /DNA_START=39 /DNA_END=593 /DNA_ORIENTATION=-